MIIVQFLDLEELIYDLAEDYGPDCTEVVRVEAVEIVASTFKDINVQIKAIGVHVGAVNTVRNNIATCFIPTGSIRLMGGVRPKEGDPEHAKWSSLWKEVKALERRIIQRLDDDSWIVRRGLIDIGDTKLCFGGWQKDPAHE